MFLYAYSLPHLWMGITLVIAIWSPLRPTPPVLYTLVALFLIGPIVSTVGIWRYVVRQGWSWRRWLDAGAYCLVLACLGVAILVPQRVAYAIGHPQEGNTPTHQTPPTSPTVAEPSNLPRPLLL